MAGGRHVCPRHTRIVKVWSDCSGMESPLWALKYLGVPFQCVQRAEIDASARAFALHHFGPALIEFNDVMADRSASFREWNSGRIDLYTCGSPCTTFSTAGLGAGLSDARGQISGCMLHAIQELQPRTFLLENVKGLATATHRSTLLGMLRVLVSMHNRKYSVQCRVINSCEHGLPQNRERLFIIGIDKDSLQGTWIWPEAVGHARLNTILDPLGSPVLPSCMPPASQSTARRNFVETCRQIIERLQIHPFHSDIAVDIDCSWGPRWMQGIVPCLTRARCSSQSHWLMNRGRRMNIREMLRTMGIHPRDVDLECVSRAQLGKLLGNAMSVHLLERLLRILLSVSGLVPRAAMTAKWETADAMRASAQDLACA